MTNAKILVVSSNILKATVIDMGLSKIGYDSYVEYSGYEVYDRILQENFNLVMINTKLTDLDVIDLPKRIKYHKNIPIIMFADNKNIDELAYYLDSGADDYIAGQFDIRVMYARIEKLLREYDKTEEEQTIVFHDMFLQPKLKELYVKDEEVMLTNKEYDLLLYLVKHRNVIVPPKELLAKIWKVQEHETKSNKVDACIHFLRKKIDKRFGTEYFCSAKGIGYILKE